MPIAAFATFRGIAPGDLSLVNAACDPSIVPLFASGRPVIPNGI
jgi:hypothetical protein